MTDSKRIKYCRTCRDAGASPEECDTCPYGSGPDLVHENLTAFELIEAVRTQWRGAGFGVVGLDYNALYREADRLEIDLSPCLMSKIRLVENYELERMNTHEEDGPHGQSPPTDH